MTTPLTLVRRGVMILLGFTLPFEQVGVPFAGLNLTPNKVVAALLLGLVGLEWAVGPRRATADRKRIWILFFVVALAVGFVQSLVGNVPFPAIAEATRTWSSLILFYFMLVYVLESRYEFDLLLRSLILGLAVTAVTGFLGIGREVVAMQGERITGQGGNPNLLAFNLLIGIGAASSLFFTARTTASRTLYGVAIGVFVMGILGSLSRAAYVAVPGMAALWAVRFRRVDFLKYALPFLLVVGVAVYFAPESTRKRVATLEPGSLGSDPSAASRFVQISNALAAFASNPVSGVGLAGYRTWARTVDRDLRAIHNAYLAMLAEHGLLGFAPFLTILVLAWHDFTRAWRGGRRARKRWHRDPELRRLELRAVLLQVGYAGCLVMSLAHPTARHKGLWLLIALSTVLPVLVRRRVRELEAETAPAPSSPLHPVWSGRREPAPAR